MRDLIDSDGENRAVRSFLALYGTTTGISVEYMRTHMRLSGFDKHWPAWVEQKGDGEHLTKGGAQDWLRHLFALEQPADERKDAERYRGIREISCNEMEMTHEAFDSEIDNALAEKGERNAG